MAGNLLSIGKSGLIAAQVGMSTTGHNIANASVAGYSRQVVVQATSLSQDFGYGFVGTGTQIADIKRYSDNFLNTQVRTAQASKSALDSYNAQISQIDNILADPAAGLSPAMANFFAGVQDLASDPTSVAARGAVLSGAESLATRFQDLDSRLTEIREGVNSQITTSVGLVNSYARQIAGLNEQIVKFSATDNRRPNDLLDARDQLIVDLNKLVKATVTPGDNGSVTVSIGAGMPLVVGQKTFELVAAQSPTDLSRVEVGHVTGGRMTVLDAASLPGGEVGGLLEFRANTLDRAQNSLGRIAIGVADAFNAQHRLGMDSYNDPGGDVFKVGQPVASRSMTNTSTLDVTATIVDAGALTTSDYRVEVNGSQYTVRRLSDGQPTTRPYPQSGGALVVDGVAVTVPPGISAGDYFSLRPTVAGAGQIDVMISDGGRLAAAAPIVTDTPLGNAGTGAISAGAVLKAFREPGNAEGDLPVSLVFGGAAPGQLSGFPAASEVVVTASNGAETRYPAGTASIPFAAGATYDFGGISVSFSGKPVAGDSFSIAANNGASGDNRNARLLGSLQTRNVLSGGKATFQSGYAELVGFIGNKTREVQINAKAGEAMLGQARNAQQDVSGVNLDEEATNLLKYQQAYQAAGKVMQIASSMFDTLLSLR